MINKKFYFVNVIIPLIIGVFIYYAFRPDAYVSVFLWRIFHQIGLNQQYDVLSIPPFSTFLKNYGCDILWSYSLVFAVHLFSDKNIRSLCFVTILCFEFDCIVEILQHLSIINGTFDIADVILELLSTLVAGAILFVSFRGGLFHEKEISS